MIKYGPTKNLNTLVLKLITMIDTTAFQLPRFGVRFHVELLFARSHDFERRIGK